MLSAEKASISFSSTCCKRPRCVVCFSWRVIKHALGPRRCTFAHPTLRALPRVTFDLCGSAAALWISEWRVFVFVCAERLFLQRQSSLSLLVCVRRRAPLFTAAAAPQTSAAGKVWFSGRNHFASHKNTKTPTRSSQSNFIARVSWKQKV